MKFIQKDTNQAKLGFQMDFAPVDMEKIIVIVLFNPSDGAKCIKCCL